MSEAFNAYHEWLGLEAGTRRPNYYQLLQLPSFEEDVKKIAAAADRALAQVRGCRPGKQAAQWAHLLDELAEAKACLTDTSKKVEYDRQLRSRVERGEGPEPVDVTEPEIAPVNQSPNLYPPGMAPPATAAQPITKKPAAEAPRPAQANSGKPDPMAPVSPAAVPGDAGSSTAPVVAVSPTRNVFPPGMTPAPDSAHAANPAAGAKPASPKTASPKTASPNSVSPKPAVPQSSHAAAKPQATVDATSLLSEAPLPQPVNAHVAPPREEPKSQWPLVLGVAVALVVVTFIVLYIALYGSGSGTSGAGSAPQVPPAAPSPAAPSPAAPSPAAPVTPGPSNVTDPPQAARPSRPAVEPEQGLPPGAVVDSHESPAHSALPDSTNPAPGASPQPSDPPMVPEQASPVTDTTAQAPADTAKPATPSPAQLAALGRALTTAKTALGEHEFRLASAELEKAEALALLSEHQAMVRRLKYLAHQAEQFWQVVARTVQAFQGAEELRLGDGESVVSVVETSLLFITIHRNGRNSRYAIKSMPAGLALAIINYGRDGNQPSFLVLKGACLATAKNADKTYLDEARRLWNQAQMGGADVADLLKTLTDTYDLATD